MSHGSGEGSSCALVASQHPSEDRCSLLNCPSELGDFTKFSKPQCPTLNVSRTLRSWAVFWWEEVSSPRAHLGLSRTPSQHTEPPELQYLEWMPSTNGPPRPFSWSTSWRSFSISSDRRPCARQSHGGGRGEGGEERGEKDQENSRVGEKQKKALQSPKPGTQGQAHR